MKTEKAEKRFPTKPGYYWAEVRIPPDVEYIEMPVFVTDPEAYYFFICGMEAPLSYHSMGKFKALEPWKW